MDRSWQRERFKQIVHPHAEPRLEPHVVSTICLLLFLSLLRVAGRTEQHNIIWIVRATCCHWFLVVTLKFLEEVVAPATCVVLPL